MTVIDALAWVVALVLVASGTVKLLDSSASVATLRGIGFGSLARPIGTVSGVVEVVAGLGLLILGGRVPAVVVMLLYLSFAMVVVAARRADLATCGCFGARSGRPGVRLIALDLVAAAVAAVASFGDRGPVAVADGLETLSPVGVIVVVAAVMAGAVAVIALDTVG